MTIMKIDEICHVAFYLSSVVLLGACLLVGNSFCYIVWIEKAGRDWHFLLVGLFLLFGLGEGNG